MSRGRGQGHSAVVPTRSSKAPAAMRPKKGFFGRQAQAIPWAGRRSLAAALQRGVSGPQCGTQSDALGAVAAKRPNQT